MCRLARSWFDRHAPRITASGNRLDHFQVIHTITDTSLLMPLLTHSCFHRRSARCATPAADQQVFDWRIGFGVHHRHMVGRAQRHKRHSGRRGQAHAHRLDAVFGDAGNGKADGVNAFAGWPSITDTVPPTS